jgi:hypothetical protein
MAEAPVVKPRPWMIAAWPGMGSVAMIAAMYLIRELGMSEGEELPPRGHFDVGDIEAKDGMVIPVRLPRGMFFTWNNPGPGRDLTVFISESQPSSGCLAYAHEVLDVAVRWGVERVCTFASLACGLHPSEHPRVTGVATDAATLAELRRAEVPPIANGQIGGLNGLLLAVAASRSLTGIGLLAEIPFFAMRVPNPKAARAALSVFSVLAGIDISLEHLTKQAAAFDRAMLDAMEQASEESREETSDDEDESDESAERPIEPVIPSPVDPGLDAPTLARIEELFEAARNDPGQAMKLKHELDRLGVFKKYEERFLDLFRRAG